MNPFGNLGIDLSQSELRETAYEILVAACRSSGGGRPLTYVSSSGRSGPLRRASITEATASISAASKVKKALGLKSKKKKDSGGPEILNRTDSVNRRSGSTGSELMRVQMRITEQTDSRIRRGLLRVAAGQLGRRIESIVLPLELLQHLKASDFISQQEYEAWQRRSLKVLEAGLIVHPHLPLDKSQSAPQRLRQILHAAREKPIESGKHSESMQVLRNVVAVLSCREFDGSLSDVCHWADGIPLNFQIYQKLLDACFDVNDETSIVDEVDEVLELIKKTWVVLGINQMFHNICFMWLLFHRYVTTGQIEGDLLFAADHMMLEVGKDAEVTDDSSYSKIASSIMTLILEWTEQMLLHYHNNFYRGNIDVMQSILSLGVSAAKLLEVDSSHEYQNRKEVDVRCRRVESYIRSSVRIAFSQEKEKVISSRQSSKYQQNPLPFLSILSQNICDVAFNEKEIYSPVLKRWHPLATGVAVATLHTCFAGELKKFVSGISELNPEAIQVLLAADKLEKDLVEMAVSDSVDSEDGGKAIIQEMAPYEAEAVIANLVKSWIQTRLDRLEEWVDRTLQQENWNPQLNKGRFAPSAVEVLRTIDETLEAFFFLPIPMHPVLLPELMSGLDRCLQSYIIKGKSGCGSRATFVPTLPMLTRCNVGLKFFKKKDRLLTAPGRKSQVLVKNGDDSFGIPQLCLRLNTLYNTRKELEVIEKRTMSNLRNGGYVHEENVAKGLFGLSISLCMEGIQQLSEAAAYKVVFGDLNLLWDYLYIGEVSSSRIEPFLLELEKNLEIISAMVHDRIRTRVITDVMRASFEGFLLVLLCGGPSRVFTVQDSLIIEEDFKFLADLFWSNGDGLPSELIDKLSATFKGVLPLFQTSTENLIEQFRRITTNSFGESGRSRLPLPPTTGQWSPTEPNTILRVLCNRNDKMASKFLKKMYDLPKKT